MADPCRGSCSTQKHLQTGTLVCAFPGQPRPHSLSCTRARRKEWWPCFPLLAAVGLLVASDTWLLGYNIEVSSAEKGVYVAAGILNPQRSYEQKRTGRRRVAFEDELHHDDSNTQGHSAAESGRSPSSVVSFQETKVQRGGGEGQMLQKQGALRRQTGSTQGAVGYSNLEHHAASVREHGDRRGAYERQSSDAAEENATDGELEDDGVKRSQGLSREIAGGSLASVHESADPRKIKEEAEKAMRAPDSAKKMAAGIWARFQKVHGSTWKPGRGSRHHEDEAQAGETEAR